MGRQKVTLEIDPDLLRTFVKDRTSFSEIAEKYGVTRQAVSNWMAEGRIPPRALMELTRDLDLTVEQVDALLSPQNAKTKNRKKWVLKVTLEEA